MEMKDKNGNKPAQEMLKAKSRGSVETTNHRKTND